MHDTISEALPESTWAMVVAGGRSVRISGDLPKQFRKIRGIRLYEISLRSLLSTGVSGIVLVVPPDRVDEIGREVAVRVEGTVSVCCGGEKRRDSVARGFSQIPDCANVVLIHDAARPFLPRSLTRDVARAAFMNGAALAAVPATDTLKKSTDGLIVEETIDRRNTYYAQTPQGFRREILERSLFKSTNTDVPTDESMSAERIGISPRLIRGSHFCFKVTVPEDLELAEAVYEWLSERKKHDDDWSWL